MNDSEVSKKPNDRPSKKLVAFMLSIQAVIGLADGAEDKFKYACVIGGIFIVYKAVQGFIDWSKK